MLRRPVESALATLIGVVDHRLGLASHQGHVERQDHQVSGHALPKSPAHDLAAVDINHHRQVQKSCPGGDVGHVCHPQLVEVGGHKLPLHQVWCRALTYIAFSGDAVAAPATDPTHVLLAH